MSVILQCNEGFDFKKNIDKQIHCNNNTWTGTPECEIPVTIYGKHRQTLLLSRSDLSNDSVSESLYSVTYNHANDCTERRYSAKLFNKDVSTFVDGILILLSFTNAQCDDTGVYTCSVIVGDIRSPIDSKTTNKEMKVIDIKSEVKEIIASTSYVQGDDIDVLCKGLIGKDENGNKLGEIIVRLYWNDETNKDMNSTLESTRNVGCQVDETVKAAFVVTNAMHGAELQCIFRDDDESRDKKSEVLNVTTIKNVCLNGTSGEYDPHPYNCKRYIRCVGDHLYDIQCAVGSSFDDVYPICNSNKCSHC